MCDQRLRLNVYELMGSGVGACSVNINIGTFTSCEVEQINCVNSILDYELDALCPSIYGNICV